MRDGGDGEQGAAGGFRCVSHSLFSQRARRGARLKPW
jgi:hypothetical protein